VVFIVTNQATQAVSLTILPAGASAAQPLADTGPINPQGTAKVTVNFDGPGEYTVTTGSQGSTDASQANTPPIRPASLHIGARRPNGSNALLQP
jgi:hypothetical protein